MKNYVTLFSQNKQIPSTATVELSDIFNWIETKDYNTFYSKLNINELIYSKQHWNDSFKQLPEFFDKVEKARTFKKGSTEYKTIKSNLPVIVAHSYSLIDGKLDNIQGYNNILFYDVDENLTPEQTDIFLNYLKSLPYVMCVAYSTSKKFHIFIKSNYNKDTFYNVYYELLQKMTIECGLNIKLFDTAVGQLTRKAFLSSEILFRNDNCSYYNYNNTTSQVANLIKSYYDLKKNNNIKLLTDNDVVKTEKIVSSEKRLEPIIFLTRILKNFTISGSTDYNNSAKEFFNRTFRYNVTESELEQVFFDIFPQSKATQNTFNSLYKTYSNYKEFCTQDTVFKTFKTVNEPVVFEEEEVKVVENYIYMAQNEKLNKYNDLIKANYKKLLLLADTKLGKTTTMIKLYTDNRTTIITLPGQVQCLDIYSKQKNNFHDNEIHIVMEGVHFEDHKINGTDIDNVKLYICTYDSLSKILDEYHSSEVNLIIDELHTFIEMYSFRSIVIDKCINYIKHYNFNKLCLMTGTFINEMQSIDLDLFNKLEFRYVEPVKHNICFIEDDNNHAFRTMLTMIKKDIKNGKRVLLHNNNITQNKQLYYDLQPIKTILIDSEHKLLDIKDEQLIIATATFDVGLGISKNIDNVYIKTNWLNKATFLSVENIIQIINRDDRENKINKPKNIFIFNNFRDVKYNLPEYININIEKIKEFAKKDDAVLKTLAYQPIVMQNRTDITFDFIQNGDIVGNEMVEMYLKFHFRKEYQYINKEYLTELVKTNNFNVISIDEIDADDIKLSKIKKDYIKLNNSVNKIGNGLLKHSDYNYKQLKELSKEDVEVSKLIDEPEFKDEFIDTLKTKGYKDFVKEYTQYKNINSLNDENKMFFEKYLVLMKRGEWNTIDRLLNIFNHSPIFKNLPMADFLPKLKEWCDIKIKKASKTEPTQYQLKFPLNTLTSNTVEKIVFKAEYTTKEDIFTNIEPKYKVLFDMASIDVFWLSFKKYCKINGLTIESKQFGRGESRGYKYFIK